MKYSDRLRELREHHGLTQADVAKVLKTSQQYYGKYELGIRPISVDKLVILCKLYNVSADYILNLPDRMPYGLSKTSDSGKTRK